MTTDAAANVSEKSRLRLRVGVMLNEWQAPRWVERVLSELRRSDHSKLCVFILNAGQGVERSRLGKLRDASSSLLYRMYERFDRRLAGGKRDPLEPTDLRESFFDVPVLPISERFEATELDRIRTHDLDVILHFGFGVIRGGVFDTARCGIWSYQHEDCSEYYGASPLFWEIYEGNPVSEVSLRILGERRDAGGLLYRSLGCTNMTSLHRNRAPIYWKASEFVGRRLRDLATRGFGEIEGLDTCMEQTECDRRLYRRPGNLQMLRYLARVGGRILRNRLANRFYYNLWVFGIRRREDDALVPPSPERYHMVSPPPGRGYADPFPLERDGRAWIFFEDISYSEGRRGRISVAEFDDGGRLGEVATALERPYHLSYPYVFEWDGETWMLPETSENRSLEIYRAVEFPYRWELEKVIFEDLVAVDATLFEHADRWWLFVNQSVAGGGQDDELFVYWSDSPLGQWTPHRNNPVVSDVTRARPAGRPFRVGGDLIRPAQDGSRDYGYALTLNRVEVLTESEYRETLVERITPDWLPNAIGTHHLARSEHFEVIDAKVRARR